MSQIEALRTTATQWRTANPDRRGGVVLIWQGSVYGWKNCLRDASHEQPGAYAGVRRIVKSQSMLGILLLGRLSIAIAPARRST